MDTYRKMRNDKLAEAMIKKLAARNIEGYYVQTKEEAKELALSLIPEEPGRCKDACRKRADCKRMLLCRLFSYRL